MLDKKDFSLGPEFIQQALDEALSRLLKIRSKIQWQIQSFGPKWPERESTLLMKLNLIHGQFIDSKSAYFLTTFMILIMYIEY